MYPKLLNYPSVVRAGFLMYSHKHHHSEAFKNDLSTYVSRPVASKWRRAAQTIDLHPADYVSEGGKQKFIPSAICFECQEHDLALVRTQLQTIYPIRIKSNRFEYPRQTRASFCNTYNRYELDQVDDHSKEVAKSLWHVQLLTNQRERYASIAHLLRHPSKYEATVMALHTQHLSVRRLLLEMKVPYEDDRGEYPWLFTSVDDALPFDSNTRDVGVTFRPQHAKYAQNAIEHLSMHFEHSLGCNRAYLKKLFKSGHLQTMQGKKWHTEYKKAYDPKNIQEGMTQCDLSRMMTEFNLDMAVVLQDAAMAVSRPQDTVNDEDVSAPRAASNASQQLSRLNSITTMRELDDEMEDTSAVDQATNNPGLQTQTNFRGWPIRLGSVATRISQPTLPTARTTTTKTSVSADTATTQTTSLQEDSSLTTTTTTEHMVTEEQVKHLLDERDRKWQAKMAVEIALRVAHETKRKEHLARKTRRTQTQKRDQTAHSHGGGKSP